MSVVHTTVTGLDYLEKGLKNLRGSKMMAVKEFKDMFSVMQHHYEELRLSHLTGKTADMMRQAESDTKFYNILVKMLCEVRQDQHSSGVYKVYSWYLANKHVLYSCGSHFGKDYHKRQSQKHFQKTSLSPREAKRLSVVTALEEQKAGTDTGSDFSDTELDIEFKSEKEDNEIDSSRVETLMLGTKTTDKTTPVTQSESSRKMVHSVTSMVNPYADPCLTLDLSQDSGLLSPGQQRGRTVRTSTPPALPMRIQISKKPEYDESTTLHQYVLDMRHRLHTPDSAHIVHCKDCEIQKYKDINRPIHDSRKQKVMLKGKQLEQQSLEEFYDTAEKLYPFTKIYHKVWSEKSSRKTKSAPSGGEMCGPTTRKSSTTDLSESQRLTRRPSTSKNVESQVKMDTVMSVIDSVSQDMTINREKWCLSVPSAVSHVNPHHHKTTTKENSPPARNNTPVTDDVFYYHQPMYSNRPGSLVRPNSQEQDEKLARIMLVYHQTSGASTPCHGSQAATSRNSRSRPMFGKPTLLNKTHQPSLRSAGGSRSSEQRPRTAPVFRHKKHHTKSKDEVPKIDDENLNAMMQVKYLGGTSNDDYNLDEFQFDEDFFKAVRNLSESVTENQPPLEYISFVKPQESKSSRNTDKNSKTEIQSGELYKGSELSHDNSQQDIHELEDELRDLSDDDEEQQEDEAAVKTGGEQINVNDNKAEDLTNEPSLTTQSFQDWGLTSSKLKEESDVLPDVPEDNESEKLKQQTDQSDKAIMIPSQTCSDKWKFSSSRNKDYKQKKLLKNLLSTRKSQCDVNIAEVKYQSHVSKIASARLRTQSAKGFGAPFRPQSSVDDLHLDLMPMTRVERTAGRTPGSTPGSEAYQMLRMARKQSEYFSRVPPLRTPPSIPSPYGIFGSRTGRSESLFNPELEHHARKEKKPLHYLQQVQDLCRTEGPKSAPPSVYRVKDSSLETSLQICKLIKRSKTFIDSPLHDDDMSSRCSPKKYGSVLDDDVCEDNIKSEMKRQHSGWCSLKDDSNRNNNQCSSKKERSVAQIGRPIAHYLHVTDPVETAKAVEIQKKAAAAVDIQRIFQGYVARGIYKKLLSEERRKREDERRAAVEIQRAYRQHLRRKQAIASREFDKDLVAWSKDYETVKQEKESERQEKLNELSKLNAYNYLSAASKIAVIGPHVDVYSVWHPKITGPTQRELHMIAVEIQRHVRGWLVRKTLEKLRRKAVWNGSTFSKMVREYKNTLIRVQKQHGKERAKTPFTFRDFDNYMDVRRRYESVFDRKAFGGELDITELEEYFHECDLHPSLTEIDEAIDVIFHGQGVQKGKGLRKREVLDIVFYIYVPKATELENTRISTWMNPIIDGVEARKLLGSELVERAPLSVCMKLVIDSKRERRERERETDVLKKSVGQQTEIDTSKEKENKKILKSKKSEKNLKEQKDVKKKTNEIQKKVKIIDMPGTRKNHS